LEVRPRPKLRLVRTKVTPDAPPGPRVIRLDVERALRQRFQGNLLGVALACAAGVAGGFFWCAAIALVALKSRPALGDAGAFLLAAVIQLLAIALLVSCARSHSLARTFAFGRGRIGECAEGTPHRAALDDRPGPARPPTDAPAGRRCAVLTLPRSAFLAPNGADLARASVVSP
jgi:hypothetical protein